MLNQVNRIINSKEIDKNLPQNLHDIARFLDYFKIPFRTQNFAGEDYAVLTSPDGTAYGFAYDIKMGRYDCCEIDKGELLFFSREWKQYKIALTRFLVDRCILEDDIIQDDLKALVDLKSEMNSILRAIENKRAEIKDYILKLASEVK